MVADGNWWSDIFDEVLQAEDAQQLRGVASRLAAQLGFRWCSIGIRVPGGDCGTAIKVVDTYPSAWMRHYLEQDYLSVDPTVILGMRRSSPVVWCEEVFSSAPELWNDARDFGLRYGLAQGAWPGFMAFGLFSLSRDHEDISDSELRWLLPRIRWLSDVFTRRLHGLQEHEPTGKQQETLTQREREVLSWSADGKTSWEVAQILQISEKTVNFHIGNVIRKLRVQNKVEAAVKAASMGLLEYGSSRSALVAGENARASRASQRS